MDILKLVSMNFFQRAHYCPKCEKKVFFLKFINKESIERDYECTRCQSKVISYWESLDKKYIISYLIGTPFFAGSVIYGFWTSINSSVSPVDIFIMIINILIAAIIVVNGMRHKQKPAIPKKSVKSLYELKDYRKQNLWTLLFVFLGLIAVILGDVIIFFIWTGIETAVV